MRNSGQFMVSRSKGRTLGVTFAIVVEPIPTKRRQNRNLFPPTVMTNNKSLKAPKLGDQVISSFMLDSQEGEQKHTPDLKLHPFRLQDFL